MKNSFLLLLLLILSYPSFAFSQELKDTVPQPKTKLEEFTAKTGVVIVKGFEEIGSIQGKYNTLITVDSQEFSIVSAGRKEYGITIEVKQTGRYDKADTSYIDYDEIDSLIKGIDYIAIIDNKSTNLSDFQADYRTKGDFKISVFSSDNKIMAAISSGIIGKVTAYYDLKTLTEIKDLILKAKVKIDSIRKY